MTKILKIGVAVCFVLYSLAIYGAAHAETITKPDGARTGTGPFTLNGKPVPADPARFQGEANSTGPLAAAVKKLVAECPPEDPKSCRIAIPDPDKTASK